MVKFKKNPTTQYFQEYSLSQNYNILISCSVMSTQRYTDREHERGNYYQEVDGLFSMKNMCLLVGIAQI